MIYHKLLGVTYCSGFVDPITLEPPPTMFQSPRSQRPADQQAVGYVLQSHVPSSAVNCRERNP